MKPAETRSVSWRGRRVTAHVPHLLARQNLALREPVAESSRAASSRLSLSAELVPRDFGTLSLLMARHEAIASSYIEGLTAPILDVVLPSVTQLTRSINDAIETVAFVRDNHDDELSVDFLCAWHARLMASSPLAREPVGSLRTEQGWIGGTSPLDAALVTPPPDLVPMLLDDLVTFANRTDLDPVLQACIVHAQFELIHPFADGNGRVGRLLVDWVLSRRLRLVSPPGVSSVIVNDIGGYLSGLTLFRMGDLDGWASWFATTVTRALQRQMALVQSTDELKARWRARLLARSDSGAWAALSLIPRFVVLDSRVVAAELGLSVRAALDSLQTLVSSGILDEHSRPVGKGRPSRLFVAPELLELIDVA